MHVVLTLPDAHELGGPDLPTAVLRRLAGSGHSLGAVTRRPPRCGVPDTDLGAGVVARVRWWAADLRHPACRPVLTDAFAGADAVLHLAGVGEAWVAAAAQVAGVPHVVAPSAAERAAGGAGARGGRADPAAVADGLVARLARPRAARGGVPAQRAAHSPAPAHLG